MITVLPDGITEYGHYGKLYCPKTKSIYVKAWSPKVSSFIKNGIIKVNITSLFDIAILKILLLMLHMIYKNM